MDYNLFNVVGLGVCDFVYRINHFFRCFRAFRYGLETLHETMGMVRDVADNALIAVYRL